MSLLGRLLALFKGCLLYTSIYPTSALSESSVSDDADNFPNCHVLETFQISVQFLNSILNCRVSCAEVTKKKGICEITKIPLSTIVALLMLTTFLYKAIYNITRRNQFVRETRSFAARTCDWVNVTGDCRSCPTEFCLLPCKNNPASLFLSRKEHT